MNLSISQYPNKYALELCKEVIPHDILTVSVEENVCIQ